MGLLKSKKKFIHFFFDFKSPIAPHVIQRTEILFGRFFRKSRNTLKDEAVIFINGEFFTLTVWRKEMLFHSEFAFRIDSP